MIQAEGSGSRDYKLVPKILPTVHPLQVTLQVSPQYHVDILGASLHIILEV